MQIKKWLQLIQIFFLHLEINSLQVLWNAYIAGKESKCLQIPMLGLQLRKENLVSVAV